MLIVRVEHHDANTGKLSELGRVIIVNDGSGTGELGNYDVRAGSADHRAREPNSQAWTYPKRIARVEGHARTRVTGAWNLIAKSLLALGYGKEA